MSMDDFTIKTNTILTHDHFCEMAAAFDRRYLTKTYIGFDSLSNIRKHFHFERQDIFQKDRVFTHHRIARNILEGFTKKNRTEFTSEDYLNILHTPFELHFFNSLYRFLIDIRDGKGLYGPMSISRFQNKRSQIHPGAHRVLMADVYKKPVMFVLTDYNIDIDLRERHPKFNLQLPEDVDFDWRRGRWAIREMNYNAVYWQSTRREKRYRDLIDQLLNDDEHSFHKPQLADRVYTLEDDCVKVNGMPVCHRVKEQWRVVKP